MPLPNVFGRRCNTCGVWVEPNAGKTEMVRVGRLAVWPVWCTAHPTAREQEIARQQAQGAPVAPLLCDAPASLTSA